MSHKPTLNELLNALPQVEPPVGLDHKIMGAVRTMLTLENYHKADLLLSTQHARLDEQTRLNLQAAMSALKAQYGSEFEVDYSRFIAQQSATQRQAETGGTEHSRS